MSKTKLKITINKYIKSHAKKHNITVEQAKQKEIVKNVIAWLELREKEKHESH